MTTTLYLVRHVQAEGNLKRIFHGHTDGDVTELGELQMQKLAERFKSLPLAAIASSDLTRAKKTALAIAQKHPDIPVIHSPLLREISAGVWEGQNFEGLRYIYPEEYEGFDKGVMETKIGGGETLLEVATRMREFAEGLVKKYEGKEVLIVSHGCAIRCLLSLYNGEAVVWGTNASVSKVVFVNGVPELEYIWDAEHLGDARSVKLP